jgi:hypothetical protein
MKLQWFRFSAAGVADSYGYGTVAEAAEYAQKAAPEYAAVPLNAVLPAAADAPAFSIRKALGSATPQRASVDKGDRGFDRR